MTDPEFERARKRRSIVMGLGLAAFVDQHADIFD